jgi:hypothetical protein
MPAGLRRTAGSLLLLNQTMLIAHCPNCQHDNKSGERYCVSCGVSLDLKPCPKCGKLENVRATVCTGCGTRFGSALAGNSGDESTATTAPQGGMRAVPLIVIALAAGGMPLMWLYRHEMPVPKAWQVAPPALAPASITATVPAPSPEPVAIAANPPAPIAQEPKQDMAAVKPAPVKKTHIARAKPRKPDGQTLDALPATAAGIPAEPAARPCDTALRNIGVCN